MTEKRVFLGNDGKPYGLTEIDGEWWICWLHPDDKWVTFRPAKDFLPFIPDNLNKYEQSLYPSLH